MDEHTIQRETEKIISGLQKDILIKLDSIRDKVLSKNKSLDESLQILISVDEELMDVILNWEDSAIPEMLKIRSINDLEDEDDDN